MTIESMDDARSWLRSNPAPIRHRDLPDWSELVHRDLGCSALPALVGLLTYGDLEDQYQAMAAARTLGAIVDAEGRTPDLIWLVRLPGEPMRRIRPHHQLVS